MTTIEHSLTTDSGSLHREKRKRKLLARNFMVRRFRAYVYSILHPRKIAFHEERSVLESAAPVMLKPMIRQIFTNLTVGIVRDTVPCPYYTKFARFFENNGIPFGYVDIHRSTWVNEVEQYGLIVWRPGAAPWELDEAREKIWFAERRLHKWVHPSLSEIMFFENKAVQYDTLKHLGAPVINTFISYDYDEARQWISRTRYPFVSKLKTGSASSDVTLVRNPAHARLIVERTFRSGRPTSLSSRKQKDYVLFQDYVENYGFDLRIEVINRENVFGYYRNIHEGDFRASGFGDTVKTDLPEEAMRIAVTTAEKLNFTNISLDFLKSTADDRYYIIEASNFIAVETDMQLMVGGRPGRYRYNAADDRFLFEEGRYWVQELILRNLFERRAWKQASATEHLR